MVGLSLVGDLHHVAVDVVRVVLDVLDPPVWQGHAVLPPHVAVLVALPVLTVVLQDPARRQTDKLRHNTYQVILRVKHSV